MKLYFSIAVLLLMLAGSSRAKEYTVSSAAELSALKLQPGDKVILKAGEWKDQKLVFRGRGTATAPVMLEAEAAGKVILSGESNLLIDGEWLSVSGLNFKNGYATNKDVITFSKKSSNCRLSNAAITDYNTPDKKLDYKWISVYGDHNRVDHCYIKGKTHQGTTLVVWVEDKPNYHRIDHNYFGYRPELGVNGGETIRIGTSTVSMNRSATTVEDNVFDQCNGEMEIVSNKSCNNTIRNNLFFECRGTLTLRHGNQVAVYGNTFIGNGVKETGGIRIIGEDHQVHGNYLQGLTGTGLKSAISLMDAMVDPPLNGYWQVKNPKISGNIIADCRQAITIGAGRDEVRKLPPVNVLLTDNSIIRSAPLDLADNPQGFKAEGNKVYGDLKSGNLPAGFTLATDKPAALRSNADLQAITRQAGTSWLKPDHELLIK